ncbi:MAG: hypothetical protein B9S32_06445 [Verrucomicrobia bacterium Tous-C9LFEB]|nr:MAG: hypothetical protein B9S32_06445 [Verrucomicrobia bacterium Tous-C9LFEB]
MVNHSPFLSPPSEPVQNWNDLRAQLTWVYEGPPRPGLNRYWGTPSPAWLLRRGTVTLIFDSRKETYTSGYWIFPCKENGRQQFSPDAEILSVRFVAEWPTGEALFDRTRSHAIPVANLPKLTRIAERMARMVGREFPGVQNELPTRSGSLRNHFEIQRLLCGWILSYADAMEEQGLIPHTIGQLDPRVRQAVHILETRPLNQPLRERELAKKVGLCVSHLNKLFFSTLGKTPNEYWERKKEHSARVALLESRRSSKSIAYDLGFKSLSHFSLWVKKKFGQPPRALRNPPAPAPVKISRAKKKKR